MMTRLTVIASRETYYIDVLLLTLVFLYAVCTDVIEIVLSPDSVVMRTIKQKHSSHDLSHDIHMTQLNLVSLKHYHALYYIHL